MTAAPRTQAQPDSRICTDRALSVRDARREDFVKIQHIYAHHVLHGTATFEEVPPTVAEMQTRYDNVLALGAPYLVAELAGQVVGYCYASLYRPRIAYRYTIEDSIYLASDAHGKGVGRALLDTLIVRCEQGPWRQIIAVIAGSDNAASIGLHRSMGFEHVGTQAATGFKFGQWIDVVFMQRALGEGSTSAPRI